MSTHNLRKYLDLLNEAESRTTLVANQPVIPGQPLSPMQMATVDFGRQMGNQPSTEVQAAYDMAKKAGVTPGSGAGSTTDLVPPNAEVALPSSGTFTNDQALAAALTQENRCVKCGTPQAQHTGLKHAFAAEPTAQGGGGGIARIKQLQQELKAAGAPLGATGAGHDGIDGALGPLTRAAAAKNPIIAAKYSDVLGTETATPAATPAASQATISQLTTALDTIEKILVKYKVKMSEHRSVGNTDQMATWRDLMEITQADIDAAAAKRTAAQGAAQSTINSRFAADAQAKKIGPYYSDTLAKAMPYSQAAQTATKSAVGSAEKIAANAAEKSAAKVAGKVGSKFIPGVGLGIGAADAYNRYQKGDYTGAGIAGAAGIASLIPVVGWAASLGLDAYNIYRDASTDPKINISPEDAAVLDQNLKVLQDLSKDPAVAAAITPEIRTRLERVIKAAARMIVADTPAAGQPTNGQAATPVDQSANGQAAATAGVIAVAVPDDLVKSMDDIEKILAKYTVKNNISESELRSFVLKNMHLLTESEQMAIRRDMMNEGPASWVAKAASGLKAGWQARSADTVKAAAQAAAAAEGPTGTLSKLGGYMGNVIWDGTKWVAKTAAKTAAYVGIGGYAGYAALRAWLDSGKLSDDDKKEIEQFAKIRDKYDASALSPAVQQRLAAIDATMAQLVQAGVDK